LEIAQFIITRDDNRKKNLIHNSIRSL